MPILKRSAKTMHHYHLSTRFGEHINSPNLDDIVKRFYELDVESSPNLKIVISLEDDEGCGWSLAISCNRKLYVDDFEMGAIGGIDASSDEMIAGVVDRFLKEGEDYLLSLNWKPSILPI